ncbi:MAG: type 1 glutamine amidotransferase [Gammaproteobacteria bacterium]
MRVHYLQHAEHEGLGCIERWLRDRGHRLTGSQLHRGDELPDAADFDWLIVMGGPMNIYEHDRHPWLIREKFIIRDACVTKKKVLGICLGSQLVADVLGGHVSQSRQAEIGWFDVALSDEAIKSTLFEGFPRAFAAFHWHADTFKYPPGATPLMSSEACPNQAFSWGEGRVLGLQFHLEVELEDARRWLAGEAPEPGRFVQSAAEMLRDPARFEQNTRLMHRLLERLAAAP